MLTEQGRVIAVESDGLWVETLKHSTCAKCDARHGCGQKLLSGIALKSNMTVVKALHTESSFKNQWRVGDHAILGINESTLVVGALIAYGLPLLCMILGMFAGLYALSFLGVELSCAVGAFSGLVLGGGMVSIAGRSKQTRNYFQAYVLGPAHTHLVVEDGSENMQPASAGPTRELPRSAVGASGKCVTRGL